MKLLRMTGADRAELLAALASMPAFLTSSLGAVSAHEATVRGEDDTFSPVEQCWHLADLEREGYAVRIRRLLEEAAPQLPDFNGDRIAAERNYRALSLPEGLAAFRAARLANLQRLRAVRPDQWTRAGTQEGVGAVSLCDVPAMMAAHDASHRSEIEAWLRAREARS